MVRISETFPEVWELFRENTVPIAAVSKVSYVLGECKAPKMHPRNFGSERIVRTYYDVQKSVLHVKIRPIDLSITYD